MSTSTDPSLAVPSGLPSATELARLATALFQDVGGSIGQEQNTGGPSAVSASSETRPPVGATVSTQPRPEANVPAVPAGPPASAGGIGRSGAEFPGAAAGAGDVGPSLSTPFSQGIPLPPLVLPESGVPTTELPAFAIPGGVPAFPALADYNPGFAGVPDGGSSAALPAAFRAAPAFYFAQVQEPVAVAENSPLAANPSVGQQPLFDVNQVRKDFPILSERVNGGKSLVWLDNAATTQKPREVIERLKYFYEHENSNIHRAAHELAARATDAYEAAREKVRAFIGARSVNEVVFVRGATEAINLVAQSWGRQYIGAGDEIIVSWLEHHANIVPWQRLAAEKGAVLKVIPVDDNGELLFAEYLKLLSPRTKLVSITQVSNAVGTVTPAAQIVAAAHAVGARVLVDGAQSVSHMRTNVVALDADWFVFSGHKVFGPTGIGVLYGKEDLLNATEPWQGGGNMIEDVTFEHTRYHRAPGRFEAGTGNIADAVGLGAALDYVTRLGIDAIHVYESQLIHYATAQLEQVPGVRIIGHPLERAGVLSFVVDGVGTADVGGALSREGIAVRAGHHCAQPILRRFGLEASVRPSFAFYNTCADIDALVLVVKGLRQR